MTKTKKLFEDFRKYAIEETGTDCAEDEEEVYEETGRPHSMRGGRTMDDLDKDAKTRETDFLKKAKEKEKVDESPRYGEEYADMDGEEPQGNDNPSQDVYAMLDDLRAKLVGTPLEGDVLAILDKMDAHPEMTDTKYPEPPMAEKLSESKKTIKLKINSKKKK